MIAHVIGRRTSFGGVLAYLAGPGRHGEHVDPRVVAGDRDADVFIGQPLEAGATRLAAEHLDSSRLAWRSRVKQPVLHVALSFNENTTPEQRRAVYEAYVERMGCFGRSSWVAVEHGRSHVREERGELKGGHEHGHLVISLVRDDGRAVRLGKHKDRSQDVARYIEREHGLKVLLGREMGAAERGLTQVEWDRTNGGRTQTERQYIERAVRGCMVEHRDLDAFAARMERGGLPVAWRVKDGARVGYSVMGRDGIPYQGGKLARDLTLPRLEAYWRTTTPDLADEARRAAGRLAMKSLKRENGQPGPLARESRKLGRYAQTRASGSGLVLTAALASALRERIARANREAELQAERDEHDRRREPDRDRGIDLGF